MPADSLLHFENSTWLWALFFLLPLAGLFLYAQKKREELLAKIIATRLHSSLAGRVSMTKRILRASLLLLALAFLMLALARPRLGYEEHTVPSLGRDIMIAIDTSRSMLATDVTPTRLARAKLVAQDVLELLPGDRIGLIAFAGKAFLQAPMTLDHSAVRDALNELDTNVIPKGGTNLSEAIHLTITALGKGEGTERALILMTDGEDLEENALEAAKEAKQASIKIFTIGLGSAQGSLIPILNEQNGHDFVRDEDGKPVLSKLDVARLQEIATITGGFYESFGTDAVTNIVDKAILPLSQGYGKTEVIRRPIERYEWPLAAALLFLVLWWLLDERRRLPRHRGVAALVILLLFPALGKTTPGLNEYNQGNYKAALTTFEQQLKQGNASDTARFDAGAAAYKKGDYKKAIDYFTGAMTASSPKIQQAATYNLANALVRDGEGQSDGTQKISDWKSAIEHYDTVLKTDPNNKQAKENQEVVKKMIEDFKKQEDQKKKDPKQNQPDQQDQQQDPQKNQQSQQQQHSNNNEQGSASQNQQQENHDPQNPDQHRSSTQDQQKPSSASESPTSPGNSGATPQNTNSKPDASNAPPPSKKEEKSTPNSKEQEQPKEKESSAMEGQPSSPKGSSNMNQNQSDPKTHDTSADAHPNNTSEQGGQQPISPEKKQGELSSGDGQEGKAPIVTPVEEAKDEGMSQGQAEAILRSMKDEEKQVQFRHRKADEETSKDW